MVCVEFNFNLFVMVLNCSFVLVFAVDFVLALFFSCLTKMVLYFCVEF